MAKTGFCHASLNHGLNHGLNDRGLNHAKKWRDQEGEIPPPETGKNKIYTGKNRGKEEKKWKTSEKREKREKISEENRKSKKLRKNSLNVG